MFLNLVSPINNLGYGVAGFNILKALVAQGHRVSLWPIGNATWESKRESVEMIKQAVANNQFFDPEAPSIRLWHQHDLAMFPGKGERIGWPIFELDNFTEKELHHMGSVDRLIVCSDWAKSVVLKHLPDARVDVVPLGVDPEVFFVDEEAQTRRPYWNRSSTVFINVGKWEVRKGHGKLLEAFCKAFTPQDDVELWMMNHNPFIGLDNENWKARYVTSAMGSKVRMLPRLETQAQMRQIFNQVDWGVFPSHAEGWNLEPLELMACGVPSIITNYSGHTQFCSDSNSLLVQPNGMEKAQDGKWFHGQGSWCSYGVDDLAAKMREAHELRQDAGSGGDYDQKSQRALKTAKDFSWENAAKRLLEVL